MVRANSTGWVQFKLNARVKPGRLYFVHTPARRGIFWKMHTETNDNLAQRCPVGVTAASLPSGERWRPFTNARTFAMRIVPGSAPYAAQNVVRGTNRPDDWTNLWISDPAAPLPAWIELRWPRRISFNSVQITFDTNANRRVTLPLFRYPECVKDYQIECGDGVRYKHLVSVEGNYERRRVHHFDRVTADRLRINVLSTNGVLSARVYEVRVYDEA